MLFLAILVAALLGNQTLLFLDPITILNRTLATAVWPALRYAVAQIEATLYGVPALWGALDAVHGVVVQPLFQTVQPVFGLASLTAFLFAGLVALNWWSERFWCRYLCPAGGLLGLVSKLSLVRRQVSTGCTGCGRCTHTCPTGTIDPGDSYRSDPSECIVCFDCVTECTQASVGFRWQIATWRPASGHPYDPTRRQALAAAGASALGVALAGVEPITARNPAALIHPPGARRTRFGALCIRCGACVRVCPTQGLQPSLFEGGVQHLFTPRLVPRLGACSFSCNACGQVCPTGAIPELSLDDKRQMVLGLAAIDRNRCLPWAYSIPCIVCEEACPVADKAISLEEVMLTNGNGDRPALQRPSVIQDRCIGCGICEFQCPMGGEGAIRVYAPTDVSAS